MFSPIDRELCLLLFSLLQETLLVDILFWVYRLIKEIHICPSPLYIFLYFVPDILVFEKFVPLRIVVDTEGVVHNVGLH